MVDLPSCRSAEYARAGLAVRERGPAESPKPRLLDRACAALRHELVGLVSRERSGAA
jgi:hypothetical protein